jgi:hypothetical protein
MLVYYIFAWFINLPDKFSNREIAYFIIEYSSQTVAVALTNIGVNPEG